MRGQWNFNGFVVSDWEAVKQLVAQGVAEDDKDATRLAFNSGIDMDMTDGLYNKYMKELIEAGKSVWKMSTIPSVGFCISNMLWDCLLIHINSVMKNTNRRQS